MKDIDKNLAQVKNKPAPQLESTMPSGIGRRLSGSGAKDYSKRVGVLYDVGKNLRVASQAKQLGETSAVLKKVLLMVQQTLGASASSILLIDQGKTELNFLVAQGEATQSLRRLRINADIGIAGWVVRHAEPVIANDVYKDPRFNQEIDRITGYNTRSLLAAPLKYGREVTGVLEVLNKNNESEFTAQDLKFLVAFASLSAMTIHKTRSYQALLEAYRSTAKSLGAAIDAKDPSCCGHSERVTEYALLTAGALSLPAKQVQAIEIASLLHDIGKIGISSTILRKHDPLTLGEWSLMRQHPVIGAYIIGGAPFLETARKFVLHHHEWYDGGGYPGKLKGESIPLGARIIAVADAFDTMTTYHPYHNVKNIEQAAAELRKCAGKQFCPVVVEAFLSSYRSSKNVIIQKP